MIRAVIFDFDDTLIHTYETGLENLRLVAERTGIEFPSESQLKEQYGKTWEDFVSHVWPGTDVKEFTEQCLSLGRFFKAHPPVKGVHGILDILSHKFVLGLVTGGNRTQLMNSVIKAGIDIKKFTFVMSQDDIQKPKSDPGYFTPALREMEKLGIRKDEILFVGDSLHDLKAARNTGIHFVGVLTGPAEREDFMKEGVNERMVIPSVMELPHCIENNGF